MNENFTLIVPIFNDSESLRILLSEIGQTNFGGKFLIVDNGSSSNFEEKVFNEFKLKNTFLVRSEKNLGFGGGIKFGIEQCDTPWVGWMPGNLKVRPSNLNAILGALDLESVDFVKAKRANRTIVERTKTFLAGFIQSIFLRCEMFDSGGTPTFIRKELVWELRNAPDDYVFESYCLYMAHKMKMRICRPKVPYGKRVYGKSHWQSGIKSELKLLKDIIIQSKNW